MLFGIKCTRKDIRKIMKLIITTIIIMFFAPNAAWAKDDLIQFDIVKPPVCVNNKGETVQYVKNLSQKSAFSAGMAKRNNKGIPIVYRFSYEKSPKAMQKFIDLHECAHHQTGDVDRPIPPQNSPLQMMNESIADCIATLRIHNEDKNGEALILDVLLEIKKTMNSLGFPASSFNSRESNINNCLKKNVSAESYILGVLKHRKLN
jgi:hypothetical protein